MTLDDALAEIEGWAHELETTALPQGSGKLAFEDGDGVVHYCCLGIQCERERLPWERNDSGRMYGELGDTAHLPSESRLLDAFEEVERLLGSDRAARVVRPISCDADCVQDAFVELNDIDRFTFPQIAERARALVAAVRAVIATEPRHA
jgi:hypothetical protein